MTERRKNDSALFLDRPGRSVVYMNVSFPRAHARSGATWTRKHVIVMATGVPSRPDVVRSLKFDNVWVFVQLMYGPTEPKISYTKTQTLPNLRLLTTFAHTMCLNHSRTWKPWWARERGELWRFDFDFLFVMSFNSGDKEKRADERSHCFAKNGTEGENAH